MKFNGRLHRTMQLYLNESIKAGCISINGEYPKNVEVKLRSIHRQLDKMINGNGRVLKQLNDLASIYEDDFNPKELK